MGYLILAGAAGKMKKRAAGIFLFVAVSLAVTSAHAISIEDHAKRIIRGEIDKCFRPPKGVEPPYPPVELMMNFNPFGALSGPPQIVSSLDSKAESAVAIRIVSAASSCVTLKVLAGLRRPYNQWKTIRLVVEVKGK